MATDQNWSIEWVTFFDEYAEDFHPSFRQKLAQQLFEKGSTGTGIRGFEKYDFILLVGQENLKMQQLEGYMFALVSFVLPSARSLSVWICWKAEGVDIANIHTKDVSNTPIEFHWGGAFPINEVMTELKPYKRENKNKTNLHFDIEYYHNAFPDILLEVVFLKQPEQQVIESINNGMAEFANTWNKKYSNKLINYIGPISERSENAYEVVADMGVDNSIRTVSLLLKELSNYVQPDVISKVMIK